MNLWLILPIALPLLTGGLLFAESARGLPLRRATSLVATLLLLLVAVKLFVLAGEGAVHAYLVGDWPAPYGIVLVLDRLSALMLLLTAVLALAALLYAIQGSDAEGRNFHALFQFQLLGINGAFLTGDLFNLFVFFEILLIASYGLLLHGGGRDRTRAGLHYVVLNLVGSSLFLFAVGLLYGVTGTLNMADLAQRIASLEAGDVALAKAGGLLLLVVFGLKAAVLPLHFWLPHAYGAASAPVAALFAVMTKVGVYAIVRVFFLLFGPEAGPLANLAAPWLLPAAVATIAVATLGALASDHLRELIGYLVIVSVGTLLIAVGLSTAAGLAGALYYLIHTTLVTGGLFLLADLIAASRSKGAALTAGERSVAPPYLGVLFLVGAVAMVGMPPLSGLVGKLLILTAAGSSPWAVAAWSAILGSSFFLLMALSRAGGVLFWHGHPTRPAPLQWRRSAPAALLLATSPLLVAFGGGLTGYAAAAAEQLLAPQRYVGAVLDLSPVAPHIPKEVP